MITVAAIRNAFEQGLITIVYTDEERYIAIGPHKIHSENIPQTQGALNETQTYQLASAIYEHLIFRGAVSSRELFLIDRYLCENTRHWSEIKCDYLCDKDAFWRVDAWVTSDNDEEGRVIAYIDNITGRTIYTDPIARLDKYVQEIIAAKRAEIAAYSMNDRISAINTVLTANDMDMLFPGD